VTAKIKAAFTPLRRLAPAPSRPCAGSHLPQLCVHLSIVHPTVTIGIEAAEETRELVIRQLTEPKRPHRLKELMLRELARAVAVPAQREGLLL
jgi:hypothetical protein